MKRLFITLLLVLSLFIGLFSFSAYSMNNIFSDNYIKQGYKVENVDGNITLYSRSVTKKQAIERIVLTNNVSYAEAEAVLIKSQHNIKDNEIKSGYYCKEIVSVLSVYDFGTNYLVEVGCLVNIWKDGNGHEFISSIVCDWSLPSDDDRIYTWKEAYRRVVIHGPNKVYISTRGVIEIPIKISIRGGSQLLPSVFGIGFYVGPQVESTYYIRKVVSYNYTYKHPCI